MSLQRFLTFIVAIDVVSLAAKSYFSVEVVALDILQETKYRANST